MDIEMHSNIDAPILNWIKCQKFALMDSAIGSDIGDFSTRFEALRILIKAGKTAEAMAELRNQEHLFWHCINEVSPELLSYSALVKSINNEPVNIESDDDVYKVSEKLKKLKIEKESVMSNEAKKKIAAELEIYFPESKKGFEIFTAHKRKVIAMYDSIIDGVDHQDRIDAEELTIASNTKVLSFDGVNADHINYEKEFYSVCAILDTEINSPSKRMSIREWHLHKQLYNEKYKKTA